MEAPLLSAALIVRNEEKFLPGCLDSLAGFADEIILVDTGSSDGTRKIAEDRGIALHSFPWTHDFSAARNRALDLARGQWILYIDADERVRSGAASVRERLRDPSYIGFQVLLTPRMGATPYWIMRLWRSHSLIRFRGVIHENIWPALTEFQAAFGGKIRNVPLELEHFGYEDDQSDKHRRNLPLLERSLKLDPERVFSWCHLAAIQLEMGNAETAVTSWRTAMAIVRRRVTSFPDDSLPWCGLIQFEITRDGEVEELLEEALTRFPQDLQFYWLKGRYLMGRQRFEDAIPCFERLARCGETGVFSRHASYDLRILGVLAYESLATSYLRLGEWSDALRYYDLALAREPGRMDLLAKRALARAQAPNGKDAE
jgi:hypothetical protein